MNQTFEILLKWVETRDWRAAFEEVVPKRKFKDPEEGNKGSRKTSKEVSEGDEGVVTVDAAALEADEVMEAEDNAEENEDGDVPVVGGGDTNVVSIPDEKNTFEVEGPSTLLTDDTHPHPEVPRST